MVDSSRSLGRRGFIGSFAAVLATLGTARLSAFPAFKEAPSAPPMKFDLGSEFEEWLGKIKGKHKQVFDSPEPRDGLPFAWARVFLDTNKKLGVDESDVGVVMVLRHDAIPLAMATPVWEKYKFGEHFKINNPETKQPAMGNGFWNPEKPLPLPGMSINDLQKSGVLMGVCDMALTVNSMMMAKDMGMDAAEVKKEWVANILPGFQIVPSGVIAVNRAQEHGCTYCYAG